MENCLGIVRDVGFGMRDGNQPILWFTAETLDVSLFLIFNLENAGRVIKEAGVYDIKNLEGKSCIMECEGTYPVRFLRWR